MKCTTRTGSCTAGFPASTCPSWACRWRRRRRRRSPTATSCTWWPARWSAPSRPPSRSPRGSGCPRGRRTPHRERATGSRASGSRRQRLVPQPAQLVGAAGPGPPRPGVRRTGRSPNGCSRRCGPGRGRRDSNTYFYCGPPDHYVLLCLII